MKVVVFGFSENPDRYSYMAAQLLKDYGHEVITINPRELDELEKIKTSFHTLTLYVNSQISSKYEDLLIHSKAKRVIFNPGTENEDLELKCRQQGMEVVHGCTLVMLRTNQFD